MSVTAIQQSLRDKITGMEELLASQPNGVVGDNEICPLVHSFSEGIYIREMKIPAGMMLVGKIHKHAHPSFLMSGTIRVITEDGAKELTGPSYFVSKPGTKRAGYAVTDVVWVTVHANPSNTQDLEKIEEDVIAPSYEAFNEFKLKEEGKFLRFKQYILRKLL